MLLDNRGFRVVIGAPLVYAGLLWLWRGVHMWRYPERVRPGTKIYRHLGRYYRRPVLTEEGKRQGLSRGRIRYDAVLIVIGGIMGAAIGVSLVFF